jgi:hypothetical protein
MVLEFVFGKIAGCIGGSRSAEAEQVVAEVDSAWIRGLVEESVAKVAAIHGPMPEEEWPDLESESDDSI